MVNNKSSRILTTFLLLSGLLALLAFGACAIGACGGTTTTDSNNPFAQFRTGRFKYEDTTNFGDFMLIRTEDSQIDSGILTELVVKFDLKWETDTSYVLTYKETLANPQSIQLPELKGMNRHCYMTEPDDTSYLEVSTSSLSLDTVTIKTRIVLLK